MSESVRADCRSRAESKKEKSGEISIERTSSLPPTLAVTPRPAEDLRVESGWTVESLLYGLIFMIALGTRFLGLGSAQPLSPLEASQAWPAWIDALNRQIPTLTTAQSPLLYSTQRLLFWLTEGGAEFWARVLPALAGSLLVLIPWGLRRQLGRGGALILSLLFAVDPWLLVFSRLGDGAILTIAAGLLVWTALLNWPLLSILQQRIAVGVAALFLISGPLAWLLLPLLLGTALLYRTRDWGLRIGHREEEREGKALPFVPSSFYLIFLGTLLIVTTGWLAYWEGLAIISHSLTVAFSYLGGDGAYPLIWPWLRLLVDQPLLTTFGIAGIISFWVGNKQTSDDRRWAILLTGWLIYAALLLLLPGRNPITLLLLTLPLAIAAASLIARLLRFCTTETDWQDGALIAITLSALLVTAIFLTANSLRPGAMDGSVWLFYLILPGLVAFFVWWSGWVTTAQITGLVTLAVLFLVTIGSAGMLTGRGEVMRGYHLFAETTQPSMVLLAEDVAHLSAIRLGDSGEALVLAQVDRELQPLIGWHLRFIRDLRFVDAIDPSLVNRRTFVISQPNVEPLLSVNMVGSRYALSSRWLPTELDNWNAQLRWYLFRELRELPPRESVVLWAQEE
ncbi:MAG: hypothetical protein KF893_14505 [Caldilineaceae bacterium]|nr:hypothetical protein [Caldilineaceae bacterium]